MLRFCGCFAFYLNIPAACGAILVSLGRAAGLAEVIYDPPFFLIRRLTHQEMYNGLAEQDLTLLVFRPGRAFRYGASPEDGIAAGNVPPGEEDAEGLDSVFSPACTVINPATVCSLLKSKGSGLQTKKSSMTSMICSGVIAKSIFAARASIFLSRGDGHRLIRRRHRGAGVSTMAMAWAISDPNAMISARTSKGCGT